MLSRIPAISNFLFVRNLFGSFSILNNVLSKSDQYLELRYLEVSLLQTIFSVNPVIFWLFSIPYLEHSNEVFQWIIMFISSIWMLITGLTKLCSEVSSSFLSTSFGQQHVLRSKAKTHCEKFRQEISGFET